jgi:hypothetical protein
MGSPLLLGHGGHHTHYVVRRLNPRPLFDDVLLRPACGNNVAGFEVGDAGPEATCRSCQRAARSPRVGPTLLRATPADLTTTKD